MRRELSSVENGWDYASLSKTAKECGGVDEFIGSVYDDGFEDGVKQTCMVVAIVAVIGVCYCGFKKYKDKKKLENKKKYIDKLSSELKSQQIELDN